MGVSCLVSTGKHEVLDRFAFEIANIWLDVLGEIKEQEEREEDERCVLPDSLPSPSRLWRMVTLTVYPQWSEFVLGQTVRGIVQKCRPDARIRTPEGGEFSTHGVPVSIIEEEGLTP